MEKTPNIITIKKYLRKKCPSCGQTSTIYENLCPKCRRPTVIDFNHTQLMENLNTAIESLDREQLVLSKNKLIQTLFDESIGAYLDNATTIAMLDRYIDQQFPALEAEILDLIQSQPNLQLTINPLRLKIADMRSKLERARQSAREKLQRNPADVLFSEYSKKYFEYMTLGAKMDPDAKVMLETELSQLIERIRQLFAKINKGQTALLQEVARFHSSLDEIAQKSPIIQRQAEEYDLLEKTVRSMVRIAVN